MATVDAPDQVLSGLTGSGLVLEGVSWQTYERFLAGVGDERVFVSYDRGLMEIEMSPGHPHERGIDLLVGLIHSIRLLRGVAIEGGGSTTHRRDDLEKGVEPDACYWIANEKVMRGVEELDLTKHPAPDLVIEVDVTSRSVDRLGIYAALGVPEIWLLAEGVVSILLLDESRSYAESTNSKSFDFVNSRALTQAVNDSKTLGESAALDRLLTELKLR
ncbi:hypothetical protein Mal64_36260 [Pseudobythopirellula maris]|uniref:Putative restriction endonuclease domain-containing protein n=1 Tax=Pseudobythopirellula maris TaxID=2527991 RepID=A0A5C5ZHT8_9BACT|nr:Uma2 family endonuclease [Pseudobythopirellula maris]TWT86796.1 hypothetical protein Mal64_36260 [Pseudobythopirellula maris]